MISMLNADVLTFHEYVSREPVILSRIHGAVLEYLSGRDDIVLFGAHAVNAYVSEPRMTQTVDVLTTNARGLAEDLRSYLNEIFNIAIRISERGKGPGIRIYQVRKEGNRHLVDIRPVTEFPESETIENIRVLTPVELIASKVVSFHARFGKPKSWSDRRDLAVLLLKFPELRSETGEIADLLIKKGVNDEVLNAWREIVEQDLRVEDEDEDLNF